MARFVRFALVAVAWALLAPSIVFAQAVVTGVVKDASGAVLPGATVEAASPALIEKVRTAVSDGTGQYRIIDLRPGTYEVTFTLAGFSTVRREGVVLAGTATAVVNADLKVGAVAETITVTGETPLVDVQGVASERSITRELLDSVPTGRTIHTMAVLIPGMIVSASNNVSADVGGSSVGGIQSAAIHGGLSTDQRVIMDGLPVHSATGGTSPFLPNMGSMQEVTIDTSGISAEDAVGGVHMTIVPREGGNQFHASVYGHITGPSLQSANYNDDLAARGFPAPNPLKPIKRDYAFNPAGGGPIMKDKLWIYLAANRSAEEDYRAIYPNKNAGNPNAWLYVPDTSASFPFYGVLYYSSNGRLTWQATPRNKFSVFGDIQSKCICPLATATSSPEAMPWFHYPGQRFVSLTYTAPITNKLLVDAGLLNRYEHADRRLAPGSDRSLISVLDTVSGITYRAFGEDTAPHTQNYNVRAAVSLVTGAHSLKVGFQSQSVENFQNFNNNPQNLDYRFANGVPTTITEWADPRENTQYVLDAGVYAQDRWTLKRLTISGGLRFDYWNSHFPATTLGPVLLAPTRNISFPETDGAHFKDISYRAGGAYDVFGNGKTAVKVSLNKYLGGLGTSLGIFGASLNPANSIAVSTTRSWNDANKNFIPDCNLQVATANGECGALANAAFGLPIATTTYDPGVKDGWGVRAYNWELVTSVQQQVLSRLSVDVGYFRRWYGNFIVTDNRATAASDYTPFSITTPVDAGLPGGGGQTLGGLYNVTPAKFSAVDNLIALASVYGEQSQRWHGVDMNANVRAWGGLTLQGGMSTGSTLSDSCALRAVLPEIAPTNPYCRTETLYLTQVKGLATYRLPRIDVQISTAFQSTPGPVIAANFNATNAFTQPSLGRPLSGNAANVSVNLVQPGAMYGDRVNQVDMRFSKIFRFAGRNRVTGNVDLFNMFNRSPVAVQNDNFSTTTTTWQRPQAILSGRLIKFSAQLDF